MRTPWEAVQIEAHAVCPFACRFERRLQPIGDFLKKHAVPQHLYFECIERVVKVEGACFTKLCKYL